MVNRKPISYSTSMRPFLCFFVAVLLLCNSLDTACAQEVVRSWTNTSGKTIKAEFIRLEHNTLVIRKGDEQFKVPLNKLSVGSQQQAKALAEAKPARRSTPSTKELSSLWDDLLLNLPVATLARLDSTRALLKLAQEPEVTTKFLASKITPVQLTRNELLALLSSLGSAQEAKWRDAYARLLVCDPRLFMDIESLFQLTQLQKYPARNRFADLLSGLPLANVGSAGSLTTPRHQSITFGIRNGRQSLSFSVRSAGESAKLVTGSRGISEAGQFPSPHSIRLAKSLILLSSFNTRDADAVILSVASGHPKAMLTKLARSLVENRKQQSEPQSLPDAWMNLAGEGEFELLDLLPLFASQLASAQAVLNLMAHPTATTQLLSDRLKPAAMTDEELELLLDQLASDDKTRSREAYNELLKFNPDWELDEAEALLAREPFQDYPARHRLIDVMTCTPWDSYRAAWRARYKSVTISECTGEDGRKLCVKCGPEDRFRGASEIYWAEESERAAMSLMLLASFKADRADELIKWMASGHPKANITKFARSMTESR